MEQPATPLLRWATTAGWQRIAWIYWMLRSLLHPRCSPLRVSCLIDSVRRLHASLPIHFSRRLMAAWTRWLLAVPPLHAGLHADMPAFVVV